MLKDFVTKYYDGKIPQADKDTQMWDKVLELEKKITENLEWANLKDAFHQIFEISDIGNKAFQEGEPWKTRTENPEAAKQLIYNLCYMIKDLMILAHPYMPQFTEQILSYLGQTICEPKLKEEFTEGALNWSNLGKLEGLSEVSNPQVYFTPLDQKTADAFKEKFSGSQKQREEKEAKKNKKKAEEKITLAENQKSFFNEKIQLKVAKIIKIEENPESDKLYIETLDDGSGTERIIQSGLRQYLKPEDLLGKSIILAANLAPRKMRGIESHGMLLACDYKNAEGKDCVEVLEAPWAEPGTVITVEGMDSIAKPEEITADDFFKVELKVSEKTVVVDGAKLLVNGKPIETKFADNTGVN